MKKILIVINTMGLAGAETALISMLKSIDYSLIDVSLLAIIDRGELFLEVPSNVHILNKNPSTKSVLGRDGTIYIAKKVLKRMFKDGYILKFIPYAAKNIAGQLKSKRFQLDKLFWLMLSETTKAIDKEYDMAIAFLEGAATYYVAEKVNAKKKLAFIHVNYEKAGYDKKLDYKYYKKMNYICCVSEAVKKAIDKNIFPQLSHLTRIFPNIVKVDDIRKAAEKEGGFIDGFAGLRIVTVARLHPQKGLDVAISAFARLVKLGYQNIRWYVIGEGNQKTHLKKLIKKYNLQGRFILLGSRKNPYPYVKQADIYIQPSRFEGLSLTLQEALILNKPCITTDFDGIPDILHNGIDSIIIQLSEDNILNAIKMLVDNEELRKKLMNATKKINLDFQNKIHVLYDIMEGLQWQE